MNHELYPLYLSCFPDFQVTEARFRELLCPEEGKIFSAYDDGSPAGFSLIHGASIALLCVAKEWRSRGIGSRLLARSEEWIRQSGGTRGTLGHGPHYLLQGVPEGPEVEFFRRRGYAAAWTSVNMELPIEMFSPQSLSPAPEGLEFRFARPEDAPSLLAAVEAAQASWVPIFRSCVDPVYLAEFGGEIVGFEILSPQGGHFLHPGRTAGSVGCVGVVPGYRELGIGLTMVAQGVQWLKSQGSTLIEVRYTWLESWYGKLGFRTVSRQWMGEKVL